MKKANIKGTDRLISVKDLVREFGMNPQEKGVELLCPNCSGHVYLFGAISLKVSGHFNHYKPENCALSNTSPDQWTYSKEWDLERGRKIRETLSEGDHLKQLYSFCNHLCGNSGRLGINKFRDIIKEADRRNIWSYKDIPLWVVPYLLLALRDFEGIKKNGGSFVFRFVLQEKPPKDLKDLWETERFHLLRVFDKGHKMDYPKGIPYPLTKEAWEKQSEEYQWLDEVKYKKIFKELKKAFEKK